METNLQNTNGASREFVKQIDWELGYDTPESSQEGRTANLEKMG
jgi:hypothetical protein